MKHKKLIITIAASIFVLPIFAFAANSIGGDIAESSAVSVSRGDCRPPTTIMDLLGQALCILDGYVVPFLIGLGLVLFLVGVINYVRSGDNEEKRQAGRDLMWFGIVALFVMIGVWGFVNLLFNTFFGQDSQFSSLPKQSTSVFAE